MRLILQSEVRVVYSTCSAQVVRATNGLCKGFKHTEGSAVRGFEIIVASTSVTQPSTLTMTVTVNQVDHLAQIVQCGSVGFEAEVGHNREREVKQLKVNPRFCFEHKTLALHHCPEGAVRPW